MTKKDYELIAEAFAINIGHYRGNFVDDTPVKAIASVASDLADNLATQDSRFKRDLFLKDCGITE